MVVKRQPLTHWGRVTHICVSKQTIIGSDKGFSPGRRQAIIWTNAGILLIGTLGTNFSEILIKISTFSFKKMRLKVSSAKWRPFCLGLNVLMLPVTRHHGNFQSFILLKMDLGLFLLISNMVSHAQEFISPTHCLMVNGHGLICFIVSLQGDDQAVSWIMFLFRVMS